MKVDGLDNHNNVKLYLSLELLNQFGISKNHYGLMLVLVVYCVIFSRSFGFVLDLVE